MKISDTDIGNIENITIGCPWDCFIDITKEMFLDIILNRCKAGKTPEKIYAELTIFKYGNDTGIEVAYMDGQGNWIFCYDFNGLMYKD